MTAIVFDLDGTLIDSVGDIHAALNQMLAQAGHAPLDLGTVTSFVGKGSSNLVKRVIDHVGLPNDANSHADYLSKFLDIYTSSPAKFTTVFDHVHEVLTGFQESRRPIRHRTTHIHKNPGFPDQCLFVPVKPIGPSVAGVHQPPFSHEHSLPIHLY